MFNTYLRQWNLVPDGSPIVTRSGRLLPVRRDGELAAVGGVVPGRRSFG